MNNKINYGKGYKNEILQLLYLTTVIPYRSLRLLSPRPRMYQRAVKEMEEDKTVVVDKTGGEKNIRLREYRSRRVEYEAYIPAEYIEYYEATARGKLKDLSDSKNNRSAPEKVLRNSATQIMMYACGIEISPDKRDLRREMLEDYDIAYYNSNEIKQIENYHDTVTKEKKKGEYSKKLSNSRISGLLISPGGIYAVYNIGNTLIEWKRFGEVKMAAYIAGLIKHKSISEINANEPKEAIVIARNDTLFEKICSGNYGKKSRVILMNIDYAYDRLYAIPEDRNGVILLKMMTVNGWRSRILNAVIRKEEQIAKADVSVDCDGFDEEQEIYKLVFCIPNLNKLKSFTTRALFESDKKKYQIFCYSFQAQLILSLAGNSVTVYTVDIEKFYEEYFKK